ncbi:MAG: hypothetical protein V3S14_02850 [Anaerolineae bacterium]
MKTVVDLVRGWLLKAESDLTSAELCLDAGQALDAALTIKKFVIDRLLLEMKR